MLLKISDTHFEVCNQSGNNYGTGVFNDLLTALNAFNLYDWHKEPTLKFIERKKVYKEVVMECFGNAYIDKIIIKKDEEESVRDQGIDCLNRTNKKIKIIYYVEE